MRSATTLIEENNQKRIMLNDENLGLYEEFLLYIRTDLRVDEQAGEEVLMDLLDHLLEAQGENKSGYDLFGERPQTYADELIDALPKEKKRNTVVFIFSNVLNLAGSFSITLGVIYVLMSFFMEVNSAISLGLITVILGAVALFSFSGVSVVFKIIRSSLFRPKKKRSMEYMKAGLFGAASFGLIMLSVWLIPEFGPVIELKWWGYMLIGLVLLVANKLIHRMQ